MILINFINTLSASVAWLTGFYMRATLAFNGLMMETLCHKTKLGIWYNKLNAELASQVTKQLTA